MLRKILLAAVFTLKISSAFAHSFGHDRLANDEIRSIATLLATYLVTNDVGQEWGLLPKSWSDLPQSQTEIIAEVDGYFVVAVRNEMEGETLYVLIAENGEVLDVNFTGTFPYVYDHRAPNPALGE